MLEHFFQCPYCWEEISMLLEDTSIAQQTYVEDCEVCCNPIEISVVFTANELTQFEASNLDK